MVKRELKYEIDLYNNSNKNLGYISRNDTTYLVLNFNNIECDIETIKFTILGKRSDGTLIEQKSNEDTAKGNETISIELKKEFVNVEGIVNLNIKIEDKRGSITEIEPYFYVNSTLEGEIVEDKDTIDTLKEIKEEAQMIIKRVDDKLKEINPEELKGEQGDTWLPNVSSYGEVTWVKDNSDTPPTPVNIMGPAGRDGEVGPQGVPGKEGTFNPNTIFDDLKTDNKTVIGAINENKRSIDNISTDEFITKKRVVGHAEVMNGWGLTGNNINKLTKFDDGITYFNFEIVLNSESSNLLPILRIPKEFVPEEAYMPINFSINGTQGSGYIYKSGEVKFNNVYSKGAIATCSCTIINEI